MSVTIGEITVAQDAPFALISGPCQLESLDHARMMAERLLAACAPSARGARACTCCAA